MTFRQVHARYSLPEWQAAKLTFFAHCDFCKNPEDKKRDFCHFSVPLKGAHFCSCPNSKVIFGKSADFLVLWDIPMAFYLMFTTDS